MYPDIPIQPLSESSWRQKLMLFVRSFSKRLLMVGGALVTIAVVVGLYGVYNNAALQRLRQLPVHHITLSSLSLTHLVNPFIGTAPGGSKFGATGDNGDTTPSATWPLGMVQWGPDTTPDNPPGGYLYSLVSPSLREHLASRARRRPTKHL